MRHQRLGSRRLRLLATAVIAAGVAALVIAAGVAIGDPQPIGPAFIVIALATLCTEATCVDLRVGRDVESYTWAELTIVLGLALLPPSQLVLTSLALAVAYVATRRSVLKTAFNTASYATGCALAAVVTHVIAAPSWDTPARSALALVAGATAYSAWNTATVVAAIALSQRLSFASVYRKGAYLRWAFC